MTLFTFFRFFTLICFVKKRTNTTFSKAKEDSIPDDKMRINKFLAHGGTCSRREAEKFVTAGAVTINGKVLSF